MKPKYLAINTCLLASGLALLLPMQQSWAENNLGSANSLQQQLQFMEQMSGQQATSNNPGVAQAPPLSATAATNNIEVHATTIPAQPPVANQQMVQASQDDIEQSAFQGVTKQLLPLSPAQIHRLRQLYDQAQYAAAAEPNTPPQPTATSRFVSLAPGATPPVIRLAAGFVTSLVFLDSTGAPWPIDSYDLGNPNAFDVQWNRKDNILMVQAKSYYTYGNLAVRLKAKDASTPVMITLIPGQQAVDYRVDLRVQGLGPNATSPISEGLPNQPNPELLNVLDGVPPNGSVHLKVSGGEAQAWLKSDKMFIRTSLTILSPSWIASMTSADGTRAYEMQRAPLILVSSHGKVTQLKVEGF